MSVTRFLRFSLKSKLNFKKAYDFNRAYDKITKLDLFDGEFYLRTYPKVKNKTTDPLEYYLFQGYREAHIPNLNFDPDFYLNNNLDAQGIEMSALAHYALYGVEKGRITQKAPTIQKHEEILNTNLELLNNYSFENEPLVSILILNRNGLTHLKRLFKDFDQKTNYSNYEIIIVDNASSDESVSYLKDLSKKLPIKIIENKVNVSFSKGNNDAAKIANGEYILLLNNDIEPSQGWLNEMMGTMLNNDNVAAVGAKLIFPFYHDIKTKAKSYRIQHVGDIFSERVYPCCLYAMNKSPICDIFDKSVTEDKDCVSVTGAVMLIKKSIYDECGGLNEEYNYGMEDVDFSLKLHQKNYRIILSSKALLFHHESSTRSKTKDYKDNDKKNFNLFWKIWGNYLSKNMLIDKIHHKKFFTEKKLKIVFIDGDIHKNKNSFKMIREMSDCYYNSGYNVDLNTNYNDFSYKSNLDILISFDLDYDIEKIDAREDIVKIFSLNDFNFDESDDFSKLHYYDIIVCSKGFIYNYINDNVSLNKHIFKISNDSLEEYSNGLLDQIEVLLKDYGEFFKMKNN